MKIKSLLTITALSLCSTCLAASEPLQQVDQAADLLSKRGDQVRRSGGGTCGVYAACRAASLLGQDADPGKYYASKFIETARGSTPEQVLRVLEDFELNARPIKNLSKLDILHGNIVVANVKSSPSAKSYDHWVCVGPSGDDILVYDGNSPGVAITAAEFLSMWNGYGIVVAPPTENPLFKAWLIRISGLLAIALVACAADKLCRWWLPRLSMAFRTAIVTLTLTLCGTYVFGDIENALSAVRGAPHAEVSIVSLSDLVDVARTGERLIIDARDWRSYSYGAIEGSINVPVSTSLVELKALFDTVERNLPILVYCQSSRCGYDDILAKNLISIGFTDVVCCEEGWSEFSKLSEKSP